MTTRRPGESAKDFLFRSRAEKASTATQSEEATATGQEPPAREYEPLQPFWATHDAVEKPTPVEDVQPFSWGPVEVGTSFKFDRPGFVCIADTGYDRSMDFHPAIVAHLTGGGAPINAHRDAVILGSCPFTGYIRVMMQDTGRRVYVHPAEVHINPLVGGA